MFNKYTKRFSFSIINDQSDKKISNLLQKLFRIGFKWNLKTICMLLGPPGKPPRKGNISLLQSQIRPPLNCENRTSPSPSSQSHGPGAYPHLVSLVQHSLCIINLKFQPAPATLADDVTQACIDGTAVLQRSLGNAGLVSSKKIRCHLFLIFN